ncbi:MAG: DNA primase [Candidatus Aminicenantes bacterium]|nr:DNA primase [Candidatus Aminicenantes bacterium]
MEIIDQIRAVATLVDIASQYTALRKRGSKFVGLCPFHSEKDPSFTVDPEKQLYHCFGCGVGGDVFTLVMERENLSFPEALKFLAQKFNIPLPQQSTISAQTLKLEEKLLKINEEALVFFRKSLLSGPEGRKAQEYLKQRDISAETVQALKIGYAPNSWDSLVKHFQDKGVPADLLLKAGLVAPGQKKDGFYDRFRGRLMFPIFGLTGKAIAFGGRTLVEAEPKYLNSPETPLYSKGKVLYGLNLTKDAIRDKGEVILVEGYTDFSALFQAGFTCVVASLGTSLTSTQVSLAQRFAPRFIINYDGDAAGLNAALRALSICFEKGVPASVVVLPEKLDPDGFMKKYGPDGYRDRLAKAVPALKFLITMRGHGKDLKVPEEKARLVNEVLAELAKMPDAVVRSEYLAQAAEALGVEDKLLRRRMERPAAAVGQEDEAEYFLPAEKRLLQILIRHPSLMPDVFAEAKDNHFTGLRAAAVFTMIQECFRSEKDVLLHDLRQKIDPVLAKHLTRTLLESSAEPTASEVHDCLDALWKTSLKNRLRALQAEIVQAEKKGDRERLAALLFQKQDITRQMLAI